jgi:hypothetical protein
MRRILLSVVIFVACTGMAFSQVTLTNAAPTVNVNFSSSMQTTVGFGSFAGTGFSPATLAGRLNSNAWETTGWQNGDMLFGEAMSNPSHGRGAVTGGVVTEGFYAYTDSPHSVANPALLIQPADGDFLPGSLVMKVKNNGTASIYQLTVSYNIYVRNDEPSSTAFKFSHSGDNVTYTSEASLDYVSPDAPDAFQWTPVDVSPARTVIISGVDIGPGEVYYVRWSCEAVSGTGGRDEFGLDDITVTGSYGTPAPEINVTNLGSVLDILTGDMTPSVPDSTEFTDTYTGGSQSIIPYLIHNLGGAPLNIISIAITGTNPGDFTIQGAPPTGPIAPVSTVSFNKELKINFSPLAPGIRSAIVTIVSNDSNESVYTFKIQGKGVIPQPDMEVTGVTPSVGNVFSTNMIPVAANSTLFSSQTVGGSGQLNTFKIKNTGTASQLILTGAAPYITIGGLNPGDFTVEVAPTGTPPTMNAGFTKTFSIRFNPTASGIRTAIVSIDNNDVVNDVFGNDESPYTFLVQGTGVAPEFDLTGNSQTIVDGSVVSSISNHTFFDYLNITTGQTDRTYTITNSGTVALTVGAVTLTGSSDFTLITPPAASVAPAATTTFTIRFNPTLTGLSTATVNVASNDFNENPYNFIISGYGVDYIPCSLGATETIAIQDFETAPATPTWAVTTTGSGHSLAGNTAFGISGDGGSSSLSIGSRSLQVRNGTATVSLAPVNTSTYDEVELNIKLSSMSLTTAEGTDVADKVTVAISTNGSTWSNEIEVTGKLESKWSFISGTGIASNAYDGNGTASVFTPSVGGYLTNLGYGVISLSNLPKVTSLYVRLTINNNNANEIWAIDNATLFGRKKLSTTWGGSAWSTGVPTSSIKVIIDGNYDTSTEPNVNACECQIKAGRTVTIRQNDFFIIQSDFDNAGTIIIENGGSLVQKNDFAVNAGNIVVKRHTTGMTRYDYTYWSSPVVGETLFDLSPLTLSDKYFQFNPTINNWQNVPSSTTMEPGKGYIVRAPQTFDLVVPAAYTSGQFTGVTNNGFIQAPVTVGASIWNLIGNPYPSAIDADLFLNNTANTGVIGGTVYLWTHNTPVTNFVYTTDDYAMYNLTGGSGTAAASNGVNNTIPDGTIASGQGFFVKATTTGSAVFNNSMRIAGSNMAFFRTANSLVASPDAVGEKNRLWLNLSNSEGAFKQLLVGYVTGATDGIDRSYDGEILESGNIISFYSTLEDKHLAIQGKSLPFHQDDIVPLGYITSVAGVFTINLEKTDGLMVSQNIYLEDKVTGVIHDIKAAPYSFTTDAGTINDRFQLRYSAEALGNVDVVSAGVDLIVTVKNGQISLLSTNDIIEDVAIFDIVGRSIYAKSDIDSEHFDIQSIVANNQALIVKVTLADGSIVNKKIVY